MVFFAFSAVFAARPVLACCFGWGTRWRGPCQVAGGLGVCRGVVDNILSFPVPQTPKAAERAASVLHITLKKQHLQNSWCEVPLRKIEARACAAQGSSILAYPRLCRVLDSERCCSGLSENQKVSGHPCSPRSHCPGRVAGKKTRPLFLRSLLKCSGRARCRGRRLDSLCHLFSGGLEGGLECRTAVFGDGPARPDGATRELQANPAAARAPDRETICPSPVA